MSIARRWRTWMDARDERIAAPEMTAWAEIEQRVRGTGGAGASRRVRLRPTVDDLAAIANPDQGPPVDHRAPVSRRTHLGTGDAPSCSERGQQPPPASSSGRSTFADLFASVDTLGEAEIDRMNAVTATTIEWCRAARTSLDKARTDLTTPGAPLEREAGRAARRVQARERRQLPRA